MSRMMKAVPLVVLCALIIAVPSVWAYWVQDGVAVCTAAGTQWVSKITSDGAGGAIVTWEDWRTVGEGDIYAQRVNASGAVQWTANGVALSTAAGDQLFPTIVSDGAGGAIVTWHGCPSECDIYAQRVNASGVVQWSTAGVTLCTAGGNQQYPTIVSDGAGGAIVTWQDYRSGTNWNIYAQRVNAWGAVQWPPLDGVALCTITGDQQHAMIVSDGAGGAIVTWQDNRGISADIYTQRVNSLGAVQWNTGGVALCSAANDQISPMIVSDGAGGAIITWQDYRSGTNWDIYAQRVNASGAVQWTANGVALCTATGLQGSPTIVSDGAGGAVVTWQDAAHSGNYDIYAQRVNASGAIQWPANGVALCVATGEQSLPMITSDGAAGAIVTWQDNRSVSYWDTYAQRVNASGAVQWTTDGVALCTAMGDQNYPTIASDGAGGAIVTWLDNRSVVYYNHIYAQSIDAKGRVGFLAPSIYSIRDVPGDEGGKVYLSWYASRADVCMDPEMSHYTIWRAISPSLAAQALENGGLSIEDLSELDAATGKPVILIERPGTLTYFWELVETVEALYMEAYGKPVATLFDSTAVCNEYHYFQVVAHTTDPRVFWKSEPDSGYSVDNLPPEAPIGLAAEQSFVPAGLHITWNMNQENDLSHYSIYRGLSESFIPAPGNRVATPTDPDWFDSSWRWNSGYYYKVSAIDVHDNQSGFALLRSDNVTGVETPTAPQASYLSQNHPNPFNPTTRIAFGLSAREHVSLRIYDAAGRLVRVLVSNERRAGRYQETWDGRDSSGRAVSSGIYFYRLTAGSFEETRKMALTR